MKQIFALLAIMALTFTTISCEKKLKVLGEDSSNLHAIQSVIGHSEEEIGIGVSFRPNSFEDVLVKANHDFVNKTGLYDIVMGYNFSLSSYIYNDYVLNVDSLLQLFDKNELDLSFEDSIFKNAWIEVGFYYKNPKDPDRNEIQKVGYPFATNTMLLVYNKKMFENEINKENYWKKYGKELNVPTDWNEYRQIAEFFTNPPKSYGVCMEGATGSWLYYEYCDFLYGMGGSIFDKKYGWEGGKDIKITIDSPEAVAATKYYLGLKKFNKGGYTTVDATEQVRMILEGDVAMGLVWSDYLNKFLNSPHASHYGYAPLPGEKSPIAGGCFYVNRHTKSQFEAMKFIMYMMKPDIQVKLALEGLCSPFKSTYNNKLVKDKIPYAQALSSSLERGCYMYEAGLEASFVSDIITNHIQKLWEDESLDVSFALQQIAKDIDKRRNDDYN